MAAESIGIWIGNDLDVALQLRWGWRLARARQMNLMVYEHVQGNENKTIEVPLNELENTDTSALAIEVQKLIQSSDKLCAGTTDDDVEASPDNTDEQLITVQLKQIHSATPRAFR